MSRHCDVGLRIAAVLALLVMHSQAGFADCRGEVEAAFQKLETPGLPYRSETTIPISAQLARQLGRAGSAQLNVLEIAEFIPPDRMRKVLDYFKDRPTEIIRVGTRTWMRQDERWFEGGSALARDTFPSGAGSAETIFECLGTVAFEGKAYAGYRTILPHRIVTLGQEIPAETKQLPTLWRTILVDRETGLPAYQLPEIENQRNSPVWKMHYTYPHDIRIEPPVQ